MKRTISVLLVMIMIVSLAACGRSSDDPSDTTENVSSTTSNDTSAKDSTQDSTQEDYNKDIVVGISTDMVAWDPWASFNNGRKEIMPVIYQTLAADIVEDGKTVRYWTMATGYEKVSENEYEVTIREGIYDTAGNRFTASDAAFSYLTAKAQGTLAQMNAIDAVEVIDDYTFKMITGETLAMGDFEDLLIGFNMVTQTSYEASPDGMVTSPVGTTGYVLEEYVSGSYAYITKADSYWNDAANESKSIKDGYTPQWDCTNVDTIRYEIITDSATMIIALESGDIDICQGISISDADVIMNGSNGDNFNSTTVPENYLGVSFNVAKTSPTNNYNLRMALAHGIDSEGILDAVYNGDGMVIKAWSFPTYLDWQDEWDTNEYYEYDTKLAKEYLDKYYQETGTTANNFSLRLLVQSDSAYVKAAEAIQLYIVSLIGNQNCVEILSYDRASFKTMYSDPTAFDLLLLNCQSSQRAYTAYNWNLWVNAKKLLHGDDIFNSGDQKLQTLLEAAVGEETHSDKSVLAFNDYLNEQAYIKNLVCGNTYLISASWISGLERGMGAKNAIALCALEYDWSQAGK